MDWERILMWALGVTWAGWMTSLAVGKWVGKAETSDADLTRQVRELKGRLDNGIARTSEYAGKVQAYHGEVVAHIAESNANYENIRAEVNRLRDNVDKLMRGRRL